MITELKVRHRGLLSFARFERKRKILRLYYSCIYQNGSSVQKYHAMLIKDEGNRCHSLISAGICCSVKCDYLVLEKVTTQ